MFSATASLLHNIWSMCLHTGEQILSITQNQLSETTEEADGHGVKGRGQRASWKVLSGDPGLWGHRWDQIFHRE